jgi:4-oxalocrotonate tautomerase
MRLEMIEPAQPPSNPAINEEAMPHVIVKMLSGRSEADKVRLVKEITETLQSTFDTSPESVSVSIEEYQPSEWTDKVYKPEIEDKPDSLYKKPGYNPF